MSKQLVDTGITGLETELVFRDEFISREIVKQFVKNKSFKYFTKNGKQRNWAIIFNVLFVALFVNGNNISLFPFRRKHTSKKSLFKNNL